MRFNSYFFTISENKDSLASRLIRTKNKRPVQSNEVKYTIENANDAFCFYVGRITLNGMFTCLICSDEFKTKKSLLDHQMKETHLTQILDYQTIIKAREKNREKIVKKRVNTEPVEKEKEIEKAIEVKRLQIEANERKKTNEQLNAEKDFKR